MIVHCLSGWNTFNGVILLCRGRCRWGFQERDQGHPDPVRQDPAGGRSTPLRVQEVRWTWSPRSLPEVLPLNPPYALIINGRTRDLSRVLCVFEAVEFRVSKGQIEAFYTFLNGEKVQFSFLPLCEGASVSLVLRRTPWDWTEDTGMEWPRVKIIWWKLCVK